MGMPQTRARLDVERLLSWAFRSELPKQRVEGSWGYSSSPIASLVSLGVSVDREPGFPAILGGPHPDALIIEQIVAGMGDDAIDWPLSRRAIMGGLAALVSDNDPRLTRLVIGRPGLVGMHAKMGTRPHLSSRPVPEPVIGNNGKPVVQYLAGDGRLVEGRTRSRHYGTAARSPLRWFPEPAVIAFERIEYIVWHDALVALVDPLNDAMADHIALPPQAPARPWEMLTTTGPRILPGVDLRLELDDASTVQKRPWRKRRPGAF